MYGGRTFGRAYGKAYASYNWWAPLGASSVTGGVVKSRGYVQSAIRGFRIILWVVLSQTFFS